MPQVLTENQVASFSGNIVYCWRKNGRYFYIGSSGFGLSRALSGHKSAAAQRAGAEIEITQCASRQEAYNLERLLITRYDPEYNIQHKKQKPKQRPKQKIAIDPIDWNSDSWIERFIHWGE